jgi:hypothetical protein
MASQLDASNSVTVLRYLGLDDDYQPSPGDRPIDFLKLHIRAIPPQLLSFFSSATTPRQRTQIPLIRNRRLKYTDSKPPELGFDVARSRWPMLWQGGGRVGIEEGREERRWAESSFLTGSTKHVGNLGRLLGDYEEEREADRVRTQRRRHVEQTFIPEEDEDTDSDDDVDMQPAAEREEESEADLRALFDRRIREQFIYGLLTDVDYDSVDFNDLLDTDNDDELQERWFDDDDDD